MGQGKSTPSGGLSPKQIDERMVENFAGMDTRGTRDHPCLAVVETLFTLGFPI